MLQVPSADWRDAILSRYQERDKQQKIPYLLLFEKFNVLAHTSTTLKKEVWELRQTVREYSREKEKNKNERIVSLEASLQANESEIAVLQEKLKEKEKELNESYRQNAEQARSLFEIMQQKNAALSEIEQKIESYKELSNVHQRVCSELEDEKRTTEALRAEIDNLKSQRDSFEKRFESKDEELRAALKEVAEVKKLEDRFQHEMTKNAQLINNLNMEQERLLNMLNKVRETNFRPRKEGGKASPPPKEKDPFLQMSGFFSSIVGKLKGEEEEELQQENEDDIGYGFSLMSSGDIVPRKFQRRIETDVEVNHIQHSSQGSMFATSGADGNIVIWDTLSLSRLKTLHGPRRAVVCADFSHNNNLVLGASADNNIYVWNYGQDRVAINLLGHTRSVAAAHFTADSRFIISGSSDRCIKIWDAEKGICVRTIMCASKVMDVAPLVRGLLASGHYDRTVRTYDIRTGALVQSVEPHDASITSLTLSPDGNSLLSNSRDSSLKMLDFRAQLKQTNAYVAEKYKNNCDWNRACFSGGGKYVIAGSALGNVNVWETSSAKLISSEVEEKHQNTIACCCWSLSTNQLLTAFRGEHPDVGVWGE